MQRSPQPFSFRLQRTEQWYEVYQGTTLIGYTSSVRHQRTRRSLHWHAHRPNGQQVDGQHLTRHAAALTLIAVEGE